MNVGNGGTGPFCGPLSLGEFDHFDVGSVCNQLRQALDPKRPSQGDSSCSRNILIDLAGKRAATKRHGGRVDSALIDVAGEVESQMSILEITEVF
jgi:hypothetical protein